MKEKGQVISSQIPDWTREQLNPRAFEPGKKLLRIIRKYEKLSRRQTIFSWLRRKSLVVFHRFWSAVCGSEIPIDLKAEGGLLLPHPYGIVIHPDVSLGPNCLVFQNVTIGFRNGGIPQIEGHVDIGAGAVILGAICIGANSQIGANAVVLEDVPADSIAVGVPAKIHPR